MFDKQSCDGIYTHWNHLLSTFNQPRLSANCLETFANAIFQKSGALQNCLGFVDGTVSPVSRPSRNQRVLYNSRKKVHALKFQSVDGLVANLYGGPVEGKRHDSAMLAESGLYNQLQQHAFLPNGNPLCVYGDPAYPHRPQLQASFKGARITQVQKQWNKAISSVRVSVEWIFGDNRKLLQVSRFQKELKSPA